VRLSIEPKVGVLAFIGGLPGSGSDLSTADWKLTQQSSAWFAPILLLRKSIKKIEPQKTIQITFERILLKEIIDGYSRRGLWPTELKFTVSVEPKLAEKVLGNNTRETKFEVRLPAY
jgi:hypothetical protein